MRGWETSDGVRARCRWCTRTARGSMSGKPCTMWRGRVGVGAPGSGVRPVHGRSGGDGGVAVAVRCGHRRAGADGRVLDPGVRGARPGRLGGASGGCAGDEAGDEAGQRAQERRAGLPVDSPVDELRPAQGRVPSGEPHMRVALLRPPAVPCDTRPQPLCATHAEGADGAAGQGGRGDHCPRRSEEDRLRRQPAPCCASNAAATTATSGPNGSTTSAARASATASAPRRCASATPATYDLRPLRQHGLIERIPSPADTASPTTVCEPLCYHRPRPAPRNVRGLRGAAAFGLPARSRHRLVRPRSAAPMGGPRPRPPECNPTVDINPAQGDK